MAKSVECDRWGGNINPQIIKQDTLYYSSGSDVTGTCTIDISKDYLVFGSSKYSDNNNRQEIQYIHNGTVTSLTNNWGSTLIRLCTISGSTLTYSVGGSGTGYRDFTIIQLN